MNGDARDLSRRLLAWYGRQRRQLPWRLPADTPAGHKLDPYHVLVSEAMLQQTQVATVIPYFRRFIQRFPTLEQLAAADEQEVLRLWQGLGYYSRARNLQAAARAIVGEHGGQVPRSVEQLLALPGIGRYTAGAIASIAFEQRAPIVDGNVARVICRLDRIEADPRERNTVAQLWRRAEELLPRRRIGQFNSALMELGATVCTPRQPQCLLCPVREHCQAFAAGAQERIPIPRKAKPTPLLKRWTVCIRRGERWLIEQRPDKGRWAGMWQFVTLEPVEAGLSARLIRQRVGLSVSRPGRVGVVEHALTHRRYEFEVYECRAKGNGELSAGADARPRTWVTLRELDRYPLPRPQVKVAQMLGGR